MMADVCCRYVDARGWWMMCAIEMLMMSAAEIGMMCAAEMWMMSATEMWIMCTTEMWMVRAAEMWMVFATEVCMYVTEMWTKCAAEMWKSASRGYASEMLIAVDDGLLFFVCCQNVDADGQCFVCAESHAGCWSRVEQQQESGRPQ